LVKLNVGTSSHKPPTDAAGRTAEMQYLDGIAANLDATVIDSGGHPQTRAQPSPKRPNKKVGG
jgi:hypothetical protein